MTRASCSASGGRISARPAGKVHDVYYRSSKQNPLSELQLEFAGVYKVYFKQLHHKLGNIDGFLANCFTEIIQENGS